MKQSNQQRSLDDDMIFNGQNYHAGALVRALGKSRPSADAHVKVPVFVRRVRSSLVRKNATSINIITVESLRGLTPYRRNATAIRRASAEGYVLTCIYVDEF